MKERENEDATLIEKDKTRNDACLMKKATKSPEEKKKNIWGLRSYTFEEKPEKNLHRFCSEQAIW